MTVTLVAAIHFLHSLGAYSMEILPDMGTALLKILAVLYFLRKCIEISETYF